MVTCWPAATCSANKAEIRGHRALWLRDSRSEGLTVRSHSHACWDGDRSGTLTSDSNEAVAARGGRGVSWSLVHSRPSFSFNKQRRSGIERSRVASKDMTVVLPSRLSHAVTSITFRPRVLGIKPALRSPSLEARDMSELNGYLNQPHWSGG